MIVMAIAFAIPLSAQTEVTVGDEASTAMSWAPVDISYSNSYSQVIYLSSEMQPGLISQISYYWLDATSSSYPVTLYMGETTQSNFSLDWDTYTINLVPVTDLTIVYTGNVTFNQGWVTITLDTPFSYSGTGNLVVGCLSNRGDYDFVWESPFKGTATTDCLAALIHADEISMNPANPAMGEPAPLDSRPNTKFVLSGLEGFCYPVYNLQAGELTQTSAEITWTADESSTTFALEYRESGTESWLVASNNITTTSYSLTELSSYTSYDVKVYSICENGNSTEKTFSFTTAPSAENLLPMPFEDNFDENLFYSYWHFVNNGDNAWVFGSAVNNTYENGTLTEGSALYISNNNGVTNSYVFSPQNSSYAYGLVYLEEGVTYGIEFDYKVVGEGSDYYQYDYAQVFLLPLDASLSADVLPNQGALTEELYAQSTWNRAAAIFPSDYTGYYKLVFAWTNDGSEGANPPIAIDNFKLISTSCQRVEQMTITSQEDGDAASATVEIEGATDESIQYRVEYRLVGSEQWLSTISTNPISLENLSFASQYEVKVTAICGTDEAIASETERFLTPCGVASVPYFEGFEETFPADGVIGSRIAPHCWYIVNGGDIINYYFESETSASESNSGRGNLTFNGPSSAASTHVMSDWAIGPVVQLTGNERLNFEMKVSYYSPNNIIPVVEVYAMDASDGDITSGEDTTMFTLIDVIRHNFQDEEYHTYEVGLTEFTGATRFAFAVRERSYSFKIDDVRITTLPECPEVFMVDAQVSSTTSATVSFSTSNENINESGWVLAYGTANSASEFIPEEAQTVEIGSADQVPYTVTELTPGATYYFAVKQNCEGGLYSSPVSVTLPSQIRTMPYTETFDNLTNNEWLFDNGETTSISTWVLGSAVNNTTNEDGTPNTGGALYVSSNGGLTNEYQIDAAADLLAMIPIQFDEAQSFVLAFDWKAGGQDSYGYPYDYLAVHLVPFGGIVSNSNLVSTELLLSNGWEREEISLSNTYSGGVYNLVFKWHNNTATGTQPAAAIDNISLTSLTCSPVSEVLVANAPMASSADLPGLIVDVVDELNDMVTYMIQYKSENETSWTTISDIAPAALPYTISNLQFQTTYSVKVGVNCGDGTFAAYVAASDVTTPCAPVTAPWTETFTTDPFLSDCWSNLTGMIPESGNIYGSELLSASDWYYSSLNNPSMNALRTNIYTTEQSSWAITPSIELTAGTTYQIAFDVAVAAWSQNQDLSAAPTEAPDDVFAVLVSTDNGGTWSTAKGLVFTDGDDDLTHNFSDLTNSFTRYSFRLVDENDNPISGVVRFAFYASSQIPNGDNNIFVSNVAVEEYSTCQTPSITSVATTESSAQVAFNENGLSTQWEYVIAQGTIVDTDNDTPNTIAQADLPLIIEDLEDMTSYTIAIRSVCGEGTYSPWSAPFTFTTQMEPETLPYACNFEAEGNNGWLLKNGTATNKWYVGQLSGNGALYVSSNGTSATYDNLNSATVLAEKIFQTGDSDSLYFSFDISVGGEGDAEWDEYYDFLKVLWLPATTNIDASASSTINSYMYNDFALLSNTGSDYSKLLFSATTTQTFTVTIPNEVNTSKKLVFLWTNDMSSGDGVAPTIDNISIVTAEGEVVPDPEPCDAPTDLAVSAITQTSATVTWTGTATSYEVRLNGAEAVTVSETTYTYSDLTAETDYTVEVRAVCEDSESDWVEVSFTTLAEEIVVTPPTVTTLEATNVTGNSATLNGTVIAGSEPITIQGFAVWVGENNEPDYWFEVELGENMTYVMTDLEEATTYHFAAYAVTGELEGDDEQTYMGETLSFMTTSGLADADLVRLTTVIYPNPASERATISIDGLSVGAEIRLTDQLGKTILVEELPSGTKTYEINTSALSSGVYYVRISCGTAVNTQKLIVR